MVRTKDFLLALGFLAIVCIITMGYYELITHALKNCSQKNEVLVQDLETISELYNQTQSLKQNNINLENELAIAQLEATRLKKKLNETDPQPSPVSRIAWNDVQFFQDRILLYAPGVFPVQFSDTGSMSPFINKNVLALEMKPNSPEDLKVGDIIGYQSKLFNITIVHRIIGIGDDDEGWFAITKGDANLEPDQEIIRFSDVQGVVIGLIY